MTAYYNEINPHAAQWLDRLIAKGAIAPGTVDNRSIADVNPTTLTAKQCHFFAGIGGWSCALRFAGVPDDFPAWTASLPCQPFSCVGKRAGFADERHLWPVFFRLVRKCRPVLIFGEQVSSKAGLQWWDVVASDLEGAGYAVAAFDLCAASVGALHRRQRLYWAAILGNADLQGLCRAIDGSGDQRVSAPQLPVETVIDGGRGIWADVEWIEGRSGRFFSIESGVCPLVNGLSDRVESRTALIGYGNAIVPQLAAEFIKVVLEETWHPLNLKMNCC